MLDINVVVVVAGTMLVLLALLSDKCRKFIAAVIAAALFVYCGFAGRNALAEAPAPDYESDGTSYFVQIIYHDDEGYLYQMLFIGDDGEEFIYYDDELKTGRCHFVLFFDKEQVDVIFYSDLDSPFGLSFFLFLCGMYSRKIRKEVSVWISLLG